MKNIIIFKNTSILNALKKMNIAGTKCLAVGDKNKNFLGTLTDGDLRRLILKSKNKLHLLLIHSIQVVIFSINFLWEV